MTTALFLTFDGANGANTTTDKSGKIATFFGAATISTAQSKYGGSSLSIPGPTSYLTIPSHVDFDLGSGDFTISAWVYITSFNHDLNGFFNIGYYSGGCLARITPTEIEFWLNSAKYAKSHTFTTGAFHHVEYSRVAGNLYFFVNGTLLGSPVAASGAIAAATVTIGASSHAGNEWLNGYLDDLVIIKGIGLHTSNFTPPDEAFSGSALLTPPVQQASSFGGGSVSIQSPLPLMSAGIEFSANSDLQCPSPLITVLAGGTVSATAPPPRLLSIARDSTGDYAADLTAPRPTLTAFGAATARATAPKPTLASGGTVVAMGSASVASPSVLVQSEGRVSAMVRADLRAPSASLIGYGGAVVSVTLSGKATVEASGTTGGIAGASLKCPLFQLSAEATAQNYGSASLIAPSSEIGRTVQAWVAAPAARLTAIGTAVVTATFDAYVVNLLHRGGSTVDEVTHYTNFPFTHVVRYQNSYYGVSSTGLYLLEGTTDDGDPIEWAVQTAMEDFGSPRRKTVDSVYIEGRLGSATTVSLQSGEKTPNTYSHTTPRGATAQNHRQKLGRGVKERYHALGLAGDGEFELDAVEFNERETNRRI